jgi:hypothetical protein
MAEPTNTTNLSELEAVGFTPVEAAKMIVAIYRHPNWKPTGLEVMALLVARTFLAQQPSPHETIPHYGHGPQEPANAVNPVTHPELEEAIKHVSAYDDCQVGMLEHTKLWRLVVAARHYVWMLKRTEDLNALNAKLASIVLDDKEGDLNFIKFQFRAALADGDA